MVTTELLAPAQVQLLRHAATDAELVRIWLHGRPADTQRAYGYDAARFLAFINRPLAQVTLGTVQGFADSLPAALAGASKHRCLSSVKSLLAFGHRLGYLPFDVGRALRLPAVRCRLAERILPEADIHRMLSLEPDERNRAILALLYTSGVRVSELCGLRWRDLQAHGDSGQITVFGKGGKTRAVRLPAAVWQQLDRLRGAADDAQPLFRSRNKGGALAPVAVLRIVRRASRRAGISGPVSPHYMRHSHASHALDRGCPIHLLQATLGHASISSTGLYAHARPNESSGRFLDVSVDDRCIRNLPAFVDDVAAEQRIRSLPEPPARFSSPPESSAICLAEKIMKVVVGHVKTHPRATRENVLRGLWIANERVRNKHDSYFREAEPLQKPAVHKLR